jgi:uncharacterized protein YndB with AHSA1/START domain
MWSHQAQADIAAPPHDVWQVLVDLDRYPEWNRYASSATGTVVVGGSVKIFVPRGGRPGLVNNRVTEVVPDERLCWRSLSWYRFLAYGVRCRHLEPQPDGTTVFREIETMHGPMAGLIKRMLATSLLEGLQAECDSLKEEVERRARETV